MDSAASSHFGDPSLHAHARLVCQLVVLALTVLEHSFLFLTKLDKLNIHAVCSSLSLCPLLLALSLGGCREWPLREGSRARLSSISTLLHVSEAFLDHSGYDRWSLKHAVFAQVASDHLALLILYDLPHLFVPRILVVHFAK